MEAGNICSVPVFSSELAVKYLHVGRRKIQISLPPGEQHQSNALPQGQQRQSNPHPMPCLTPRRHYIDRCIICHRKFVMIEIKEYFLPKWSYVLCIMMSSIIPSLSILQYLKTWGVDSPGPSGLIRITVNVNWLITPCQCYKFLFLLLFRTQVSSLCWYFT